MNAVVQFDPQVPAFLRKPEFLALNAKLGGGISSGAPPRISFRGSRFRLIAADGTETPVTENGGTTLDVVVLDANPGLSKFYYDKAYDPNASGDEAGPACFSENGDRPSSRSPRPQFDNCAACPHNVWGSRVTPQGSKVKACGDVKKIAVIPAANLGGDAYMLGIPGASLKTWSGLVEACGRRGYPISGMILRLGFNAQASFPQLTFTPVANMTEQQYQAIADLFGAPDVVALVGQNDTPHPGPFALTTTQRQAEHTAFVDRGNVQGTSQAFVAPAPVARGPLGPPQGMPMPQHTVQAMQQPAAAPPAATPPTPSPRRRGRPAAAPAATGQNAAPAPAAPVAAPVSPAAVTPTSASMDALLDKVMGGR